MKRRLVILAGGACAIALMLAGPWAGRPVLLWNVTASAPVGLYLIRPTGRLVPGLLVAAEPEERLATWLADREFLPAGVPLVKSVAAVAGQRVCRASRQVTVNGLLVATARLRDRLGRPLPVWRGCLDLGPDQLLLINDNPDSLDGRYFGITRRQNVVGKLVPIWTGRG